MTTMKKRYSSLEKLKVASEAITGRITQNEITKKYAVHSTQVSNWKKLLKQGAEKIFGTSRRHQKKDDDKDRLIEELYTEIGKLKYELDWVKKKAELFD